MIVIYTDLISIIEKYFRQINTLKYHELSNNSSLGDHLYLSLFTNENRVWIVSICLKFNYLKLYKYIINNKCNRNDLLYLADECFHSFNNTTWKLLFECKNFDIDDLLEVNNIYGCDIYDVIVDCELYNKISKETIWRLLERTMDE